MGRCRALAVFLAVVLSGCANYEPPINMATFLIEDSAQTLERFNTDNFLRDYRQHLPSARAVIVMPKTRLPDEREVLDVTGLDAQVGTGLMIVRTNEGEWSGPAFFDLRIPHYNGLAHYRYRDRDVVMVVSDDPSVHLIISGKRFGGDHDVRIGFAGHGASGRTDSTREFHVLGFAELHLADELHDDLNGAYLVERKDLNWGLYGQHASMASILDSHPGEPATNRHFATARRLRTAIGP